MQNATRSVLLACLCLCPTLACGPEPWLTDRPRGEKHPLPLASFAHVLEADGWWMVLDHKPPTRWRGGEPRLLTKEDDAAELVMQADVDEATLPAEHLAWRGRQVFLLDETGPRCVAVVGALSLLGPLSPGYSGPTYEDGSPMNDIDAARAVWQMSAPVLAARVTPVSGNCEGATWARAADTPAPPIAPSVVAPPDVAEAALAALRELPAYAEIDRTYRESSEDGPRTRPWELYDDARPDAYVLDDEASGASLVVVAVSAGGNCLDFVGQLTAVWRIDGPRLELLGVVPDYLLPDAVVDLEEDGVPEILFRRGVLQLEGGTAGRHLLEVPYYGCPC